MPQRIILLSGKVSAGKSTLASLLVSQFDAHVLKTRELLSATAKGRLAAERGALQKYGESLDRRTGGEWVAEALTRFVDGLPTDAVIVVDAVRIIQQVHAIRKAYGSRVIHVHLEADVAVLAERYKQKQRQAKLREFGEYADLAGSKTERLVERLSQTADIVINTDRCIKQDVAVRVAARLGLYGREYKPLVDVLVGGAYGSEGKGHIASYLAPEYDILIRGGGGNAGHKVYEDPPYVHHLLPSGTRRCAARLMIAPGSVLGIPQLMKEIADCKVSAHRLSIDPHAMIVEDDDIEFEKRTLVGSIGSTGQGVGAATARKILRGASCPPVRLAKDVSELRPFIRETGAILERAYRDGKKILLEGTQGIGLSLHHGAYPHVTSRDTSVSGSLSEAGIPPRRVRKVVMVCRTLPIRVKSPSKKRTSGPMSQPLAWKDVAVRSGYTAQELEKAEHTSTTNKLRRVGEFEWTLFRRAVFLNGPTDLALTFADYIDRTNTSARRFEQLTHETMRLIEELEQVATAPVSLISTRFNYRSIIDRRSW